MAFAATQITTDARPITPGDSTPVAFFGFYVGGAGDVVVKSAAGGPSGPNITFKACPVGMIIPLCICRVMAATTATNLVGFGPT